MDFSVGFAVLVLVTVLVVAVIGYGIYLNRRHDHWERVVKQTASDSQSTGLDLGNFSATRQSSHKHKRTSTPSSRTKIKKSKRAKQPSRVEPNVGFPQGKSANPNATGDAPELPHIGIEEAIRNGIPITEGIIKHEVKGKRADVFSSDVPKRQPSKDYGAASCDEHRTMSTRESSSSWTHQTGTMDNSNLPIVEGIVGEVVKRPRDKTTTTIESGHRWSAENIARKPESDQATNTRVASKSRVKERVVPLRSGSSRVLSTGATKSRHAPSDTKTNTSRLEEYVVLRVSGKHANAFPLRELTRFMLNRGLKFDNVGLFSMQDEESNELIFKVADGYMPSQFDRSQIETYCTDGLAFIMCLAPLTNPQQTFERMLSLASECARCFDAVVQDEHSNKMSNQTITHYRSRVADFRRKKMSM